MAEKSKSSRRWDFIKAIFDVSVTLATEFIKVKTVQAVIVGALGVASQWAQMRSDRKSPPSVGRDRRVGARSTRLGRRGRRHTD
jgi:hypothetical protein